MESESRSTILLRIELLNIEPLIWRRVRVPTKWTLRRLHGLIQRVFGWEDRHLHDFRIGDVRVGMPASADRRAGIADRGRRALRANVSRRGEHGAA